MRVQKKQIICILCLFGLIISAVFAAEKKNRKDFSILYLFKNSTSYSVYNGEKLLSDFACLKGRNILELRLDRKNKDSILLAEKKDKLNRVIRLNYITNKETVLFEFEQDIYHYSAFTENSFYWCERCENSPEPHILYEYDSRTKKIKKLYEIEDIRKSPEYSYEHDYIENVLVDDGFIYFYVQGDFIRDSAYYVMDRSTGKVQERKMELGWSSAGGRYNNKIIREGSKVQKTGNTKYWERDEKSCIIFDIKTQKETKCTFDKRYEAIAGPLILLSEDYFLVPLCNHPFRDSVRNGLFGNNWSVCFTVYDIKNNKPVFEGFETETKIMKLIDAMLL